jgi:hypothetical protein
MPGLYAFFTCCKLFVPDFCRVFVFQSTCTISLLCFFIFKHSIKHYSKLCSVSGWYVIIHNIGGEHFIRQRKILNSHLFWLNSYPFFMRPILCRLNLDASVGPVVNQGTTRELARRNN